MNKEMQEKLDTVLETVRDPESGLPISHLGVIKRFRYNEEKREIYIFSDFLSHQPSCMACVGIASTIITTIKRLLREELEAAFPEVQIIFV